MANLKFLALLLLATTCLALVDMDSGSEEEDSLEFFDNDSLSESESDDSESESESDSDSDTESDADEDYESQNKGKNGANTPKTNLERLKLRYGALTKLNTGAKNKKSKSKKKKSDCPWYKRILDLCDESDSESDSDDSESESDSDSGTESDADEDYESQNKKTKGKKAPKSYMDRLKGGHTPLLKVHTRQDGSTKSSSSDDVDPDCPWYKRILGMCRPAPAPPITSAQLECACQCRHGKYAAILNDVFKKYKINSQISRAAFIAQTCHESAKYAGSMEEQYPHRSQTCGQLKARNKVGECTYYGRGPMQITFRNNYYACGKALSLDLLKNPSLLNDPRYGFMSAGWWWAGGSTVPGCDDLSEYVDDGDFDKTTGCIFGTDYASNRWAGNAQRRKYFAKAKQCLGV